jgi:hypothetical protein
VMLRLCSWNQGCEGRQIDTEPQHDGEALQLTSGPRGARSDTELITVDVEALKSLTRAPRGVRTQSAAARHPRRRFRWAPADSVR